MRDAGRDDRQRVERLYQVGLRKAKVRDYRHTRGKPHSMAGRAVTALVGRIGLRTPCRGGTVLCGRFGGLCHHVLVIAVPVRTRVMGVFIRTELCERKFSRCTGVRPAKDHCCRRVPLEGNGQHNEPEKKQASPVHMEILSHARSRVVWTKLQCLQPSGRSFANQSVTLGGLAAVRNLLAAKHLIGMS